MKTIQVDLRLSGLIDVSVPDDFDVDSIEPTPEGHMNAVEPYIDWKEALNLLDSEVEIM